jgi:hypothetical protein
MMIAMLEREIDRRSTGGLSELEAAHRDDISPTPRYANAANPRSL